MSRPISLCTLKAHCVYSFVMNWVFFLLITIAYGASVWHQWHWHISHAALDAPMQLVTAQLLHAANDAVTLAIGLMGVLCLFLGLLRILEDAGVLAAFAKCIYPILKPLFPE